MLQLVSQDLRVLAVANVLLPVEEPVGDLVLPGVLHDRDHAINLGRDGGGGGGGLIMVVVGIYWNRSICVHLSAR